MDTYNINPTVDAFGGGGLIGSVTDVAEYFQALFGGRVFNQPATLLQFTAAPEWQPDSEYRHDVFAKTIAGCQLFYHGGYWGTLVVAVPALDLVVAGATLDQSGYVPLRDMSFELAGKLIKENPGACHPQ